MRTDISRRVSSADIGEKPGGSSAIAPHLPSGRIALTNRFGRFQERRRKNARNRLHARCSRTGERRHARDAARHEYNRAARRINAGADRKKRRAAIAPYPSRTIALGEGFGRCGEADGKTAQNRRQAPSSRTGRREVRRPSLPAQSRWTKLFGLCRDGRAQPRRNRLHARCSRTGSGGMRAMPPRRAPERVRHIRSGRTFSGRSPDCRPKRRNRSSRAFFPDGAYAGTAPFHIEDQRARRIETASEIRRSPRRKYAEIPPEIRPNVAGNSPRPIGHIWTIRSHPTAEITKRRDAETRRAIGENTAEGPTFSSRNCPA